MPIRLSPKNTWESAHQTATILKITQPSALLIGLKNNLKEILFKNTKEERAIL